MDSAPLLGPSEAVMQDLLRRSASDAAELDERRMNEAILESSRDIVPVRKREPDREPDDDGPTEKKRARHVDSLPTTHMEKLMQAARRSDQATFMCNREIRDEDLPPILRIFLGDASRTNWNFSFNPFTAIGARTLAEAVARAPRALNLLGVCDVHIGIDGATALLVAVSHSNVRDLRMENVGMSGEADAEALAHVLRRHAPTLALKYLAINGNAFGDRGSMVVVRALRHLSDLSQVSMFDCGQGGDAILETATILRSVIKVRGSCWCHSTLRPCFRTHIVRTGEHLPNETGRIFHILLSTSLYWLTSAGYWIGVGAHTTNADIIDAMVRVRIHMNEVEGRWEYTPSFGAKLEVHRGNAPQIRQWPIEFNYMDSVSLACVAGDESRRRAALVFAFEQKRFPLDVARILAEESTSYVPRGDFRRQEPPDTARWETV